MPEENGEAGVVGVPNGTTFEPSGGASSGDDHLKFPADKLKRKPSASVSQGRKSVFDDDQEKVKEKKKKKGDDYDLVSLPPPHCCILGDDALSDAITLYNLIIGKKPPDSTTTGLLPPPTAVSADYILQTFPTLGSFPHQALDAGFLLQVDTFDSFSTRALAASAPLSTGDISRVCYFAIVVVNIKNGLQRRTGDFISFLHSNSFPFVIALTRINGLNGWKSCRKYTSFDSALSIQSVAICITFRNLISKFESQLYNQYHIATAVVFQCRFPTTAIVPIGAFSGEGITCLLRKLFACYLTAKHVSTRHLRKKAPGETSNVKSATYQAGKEATVEASGETVTVKSGTHQPVKESNVEVPQGIRDQDFADGDLVISPSSSPMECLGHLVKCYSLPLLPAKYLLQLKVVSKQWNRWIAGSFLAYRQSIDFRSISGFFCQDCEGFSFMTLNDSLYGIPDPSLKFLPEQVVIRYSCNGLLLCQGKSGENVYYVCNPTNKEFDVLPLPTYFHGDVPKIVLAFEPSVEIFVAKYKVICPILVSEKALYFEVYDSSTRSWKCCSAGDGVKCDFWKMGDGFFSGGMVYWENLRGGYVGFDIRTEQCHVRPRPFDIRCGGFLSQISGRLCYVQPHAKHEYLSVDLIFGNDSVNVSYSLSIPKDLLPGPSQECHVIPCVSADVLMIRSTCAVYFYNIKYKEVEFVREEEYLQSGRYIPYVNSLVPLF